MAPPAAWRAIAQRRSSALREGEGCDSKAQIRAKSRHFRHKKLVTICRNG